MRARFCFAVALVVALACGARQSRGQYTFRLLHPEGYVRSFMYAVNGGTEGGWVELPSGQLRAALWHGATPSITDLHPAGYAQSIVYGVAGGQQVGTVDGRAALCLHPTAYAFSEALGTSGAQQVGYGHVPAQRVDHALLWTGSPQSVVDLHPARDGNSRANAVVAGQQAGQADNRAMLWYGTSASAVDVHPQATWCRSLWTPMADSRSVTR